MRNLRTLTIALAAFALRATVAADAVAGDESFEVAMDIEHFAPKGEGQVRIKVVPKWSPLGAEQFRKLVEAKFYDGACFFRVIEGFVAQAGIPADPATSLAWKKPIRDDPSVPSLASNTRGYISFATSGPNSRTYQFFINYVDNRNLDHQGFTPFAVVEQGMEEIDKLYKTGDYGPDQGEIQAKGNAYLKKNYPNLSCMKSVRVIVPAAAKPDVEDKVQIRGIPTGENLEEDFILSETYSNNGEVISRSTSIVLFVVGVIVTTLGCFRLNSRRADSRDLNA